MFYARKRHCADAAILAGFSPEEAERTGEELISSGAVRRMVARAGKRQAGLDTVRAGLERLAFGRANDAAKLVFCEEMPEQDTLAKLDLFNVSEMKRVKGGGVEIKLFDRQKALEKLLELESEQDGHTAAESFFKALRENSPETENAGEPADGVL